MSSTRVQEYFKTLSATLVRINPFTSVKTGLVAGQTILKIEDYTLICSPYQLSMKKAVLLLILSKEETHFFQQYRDSSCFLSFTFQKPGAQRPLMFDVKSEIVQLGPVKGKQNICMIEVSFTAYPPELIEILGDFILVYNSLRGYYSSFRGRDISIDKNSTQMLRYNNYMECYIKSRKIRVNLINLSVNRLILDLPANTPAISVGDNFSSKLYFQLYQFMVTGKVAALEKRAENFFRIQYDIGFAPELVEILDDYFYRISHPT